MKFVILFSFALTYIVGYAKVIQLTNDSDFVNGESIRVEDDDTAATAPIPNINCKCNGHHYNGFHFSWFKFFDWENHSNDYRKVFECDKNKNCENFFNCDKNLECANIINSCHNNGNCTEFFNTCDKSNNCYKLFGCNTFQNCEREPIFIEDINKTCDCTKTVKRTYTKTESKITPRSEPNNNNSFDWLNLIPYTFLY